MQIPSNTNGFTLIEILIATVIITIASLGIATLTVGVIRGNSLSMRMTTATTLAQDRLEEAKRLGYSKVNTIAVTENYGNIVNYSGYKRDTAVSNILVSAGPPVSNLKKIDVVVYWDANKHVTLSSILAE